MLPTIYEDGTTVEWREGLSPLEWPDNQPLSARQYSILMNRILGTTSTYLWDLNPKPGDIVRVAGFAGRRDHEGVGVFIGHLQDQDSLNRGELLSLDNILYRIKAFSTGKYNNWSNVEVTRIH